MITKQVIVVRKDLTMRKGKFAAQAAHASLAFLTDQVGFQTDAEEFTYLDRVVSISHAEYLWFQTGFRKIVVGCQDEAEFHDIWRRAIDAGLKVYKIEDKGLTEFHGKKTWTALAIGPDFSDRIDPITSKLQLL